jgi:uncharacterized protein YjbI with pentapeptide repeats
VLNGVRANFNGANLSGADLLEADLSGADLTGGKLYKTNFNKANVHGTIFQGTQMWSLIFTNLDISRARDEKQFHAAALAKLQREHKRLQDRIEAM